MTCSFDSNVLVYCVTPPMEPRRARAREIVGRAIRRRGAVLLLQALCEFSHVSTRKLRVAPDRIRRRATSWGERLSIHPAAPQDLEQALAALRDHRLAFWDAMLWATARRVGVDMILTEDLQDGRVLGGVRFVNPFDPANDALVDRVLPP
jgi:predicted nucleic acid-binding protein